MSARMLVSTLNRGSDERHAYRLAIYRGTDSIEVAEESRELGGSTWNTKRPEVVEIPIAQFHEFLDGLVTAKAVLP